MNNKLNDGIEFVGNKVRFSIYSKSAKAINLLLFSDVQDSKPQTISLKKNNSLNIWSVELSGIRIGQVYAYQVFGEDISFDKTKCLIDPFGFLSERTLYNRDDATKRNNYNYSSSLKSILLNEQLSLEDIKPNILWKDTVIYELHVKGFTILDQSISEDIKPGTFNALKQKIPYLKNLGITTVELLPIFAFDEQDAPVGKLNYWGYSPINYFSLHPSYSQSHKIHDAILEFQKMVKAFHNVGMEVILDVVYNHTGEGSKNGPVLSFRGIDDSTYYIKKDNGDYFDASGCGNTLNSNNPQVIKLIIESLKFWINVMNVDGFRFDLASVHYRDEKGDVMTNSSLFDAIRNCSTLRNCKLIGEPWDTLGLNLEENFPDKNWHIWNGKFRDTVRCFVRGDYNMVSNFKDVFIHGENKIQMITCHDGFTLRDLVSYNEKNNIENGENNKDGNSQNFSCNYGVEGDTDKVEILKIRERQSKNFLTILLLAEGVPLLSMGDELGRTQKGNNNSYVQDNEISYINWNFLEENNELFEFVQNLIKLRKAIRNSKETHFEYRWSGVELFKPDYSYFSQSISLEIKNTYNTYFIIFNMHKSALEFELPKGKWKQIINTYSMTVNCLIEKLILVEYKTIIVLQLSHIM